MRRVWHAARCPLCGRLLLSETPETADGKAVIHCQPCDAFGAARWHAVDYGDTPIGRLFAETPAGERW